MLSIPIVTVMLLGMIPSCVSWGGSVGLTVKASSGFFPKTSASRIERELIGSDLS